MTDGPKKTPRETPGADHPTEHPPFDPDAYARESESRLEIAPNSASKRDTSPPVSRHDRLRDSCKDLRVAARAVAAGRHTAIPTLGAVAVLLVSREDLAWFDLEPHVRALADRVDGEMIVEEILAVAHVDVDQGIGVFGYLAVQGIVGFRAA